MVYNKAIKIEFPRATNDNGFLSRPNMAYTQVGAHKKDFGVDSQTELKELIRLWRRLCGWGLKSNLLV